MLLTIGCMNCSADKIDDTLQQTHSKKVFTENFNSNQN